MMQSKMKIMAAALLVQAALGGVALAAPPSPGQMGGSNPAAQLERTREAIEQERVAEQIREDRARQGQSKVENPADTGDMASESEVTFDLKALDIDRSEVLNAAELEDIRAKYVGKPISIKRLYDIVREINDLYVAKGFISCRAYLPEQTISGSGGVVRIALFEGRVGSVTVQGNKTTRERFIKDRLHLTTGDFADINLLNNDLMRFNSTTDVRLQCSLQAGKEKGTTDYVLKAVEPQRRSVTLFADNAGSYSTGEARTGIFLTDRSLSGNRDALTLGYIGSEGTDAVSALYSRHAGHSGAKVELAWNTNAIEIVRAPWDALKVKGHANAYMLSYVQPWLVTPKTRSEISLEYGYQNSKTTYTGQPWVDDTLSEVAVNFALTNYGKRHVFYQKHTLSTAAYNNEITDKDRQVSAYRFNGLYQKAMPHRQTLTARLFGQRSGNRLMPSARQFYIGGMNSVRGYKESFLSGDHGVRVNLEYDFPFYQEKTAKASAFVFYDYGNVWGDSAFPNHVLASTGFGLRGNVGNNYNLSFTCGMPLLRELNGTKVSKTRFNLFFSALF